jgi:hypothetical protein
LSGDAPPPLQIGELIFRRVRPVDVVWDEQRECMRASSALFRTREMSVVLGEHMGNRRPESIVKRHPDNHLVAFPYAVPAGFGVEIRHDPVQEEPAHGLVVRATAAASKAMHRAARWVDPPNPPEAACETPKGPPLG